MLSRIELVMVLHLEGHVLQDLDEQLCRKLNKSQLAVCTSTTTRASCLMEEIVGKYLTNFRKNVFIDRKVLELVDIYGNIFIITSPSHSPFLEQCVRVCGRILIGDEETGTCDPTSSRPPSPPRLPSHYFSPNHPPASGSCTFYNPPYLHPRSASIGILIVILAVYHGVVVPQARLNFYFFPTSTAAKKTCHFVSRLWKTFKAGNCLNAQTRLTLVDGLWVSLGRNEWDQNLSFVL